MKIPYCKQLLSYLAFYLVITGLLKTATAGQPYPPNQLLLDETVAVVTSKIPLAKGISIITAKDLYINCKLELIKRFGPEGLKKEYGKSFVESVLNNMIDETVVMMEVSRLNLKEIEEELIKEKVSQLAEPFGGEEKFWKELGEHYITKIQVFEWLGRSIKVEQYIDVQFLMNQSDDTKNTGKFLFREKFIKNIKERYRIWNFLNSTKLLNQNRE